MSTYQGTEKQSRFSKAKDKVKNLFNKKTTKTDYSLDSFSSYNTQTFEQPIQTETSRKLSLKRPTDV